MKIEICNTCDGCGEVKEYLGGRNNDYEFKTCESCNGTGRVLTREYTIQVPYGFDKDKIYKCDSEIMKLIRKLEKK